MKAYHDIQRNVTRFTFLSLLLILQGSALAAGTSAFAAPSVAEQSGGTPGVGRLVLSLILVLALLLGGAWVTRRVSGMVGGTNQRLRMLANISLGARERAVLISVDGRDVLLGVAPGNVRTLLIGDPVSTAEPAATGGMSTAAAPEAEAAGSGVAGIKSNDLKSAFGDILRRSLGR